MYATSKYADIIAWQNGGNRYGAESVHVLNLNSGENKEIRAEEGGILKVEGFIGHDLVISMKHTEDVWLLNGYSRSIPAYAVEILDDELNVLKLYIKEGLKIDEVITHDGRVNMTLVRKTGDGEYEAAGEDTLVSSAEAPERSEEIGSYISDDKGRVYYVQLSESYKRIESISSSSVLKILNEGTRVEGLADKQSDRFYAYGEGRLLGSYSDAAEASNAAYEKMGSVRYRGTVIYNRAGTVTSRILDSPEAEAAVILDKRKNGELLDLRGLSLRPVLSYVSRKCYVLVYSDKGTALLIYAYDKSHISVYNIEEKYSFRMDITEAEKIFEKGHNEFFCDLSGQGL